MHFLLIQDEEANRMATGLCGGRDNVIVLKYFTFVNYQKLEQLRATMKEKFARSADSGIKIGFRLPDGNKTDHTFPTCSTVTC